MSSTKSKYPIWAPIIIIKYHLINDTFIFTFEMKNMTLHGVCGKPESFSFKLFCGNCKCMSMYIIMMLKNNYHLCPFLRYSIG